VLEPERGREGSVRELLPVAIYGGLSAAVAFALSFGSLILFIVNFFIIGGVLRLVAWKIMRQRGQKPPRGWWV
jgi:large-conductance mechanosensitive channel